MKKSVVAISISCFLPFLVYATENNDLMASPSVGVIIGTLFWWVLLFTMPLLVIATIFLSIRHFFRKNVGSKKGVPVGAFGMMIRMVVPYCVFAGMLVFNKHQVGGYACDCFANDYEKITVDMTAILFLIISIGVVYFMKKNKKEWKALYTLLIIVSFFITFYLAMAIGEYFYT